MEKLFTLQVQQSDAELIIRSLQQSKESKANQIAEDLNERFIWNYRQSAIKK